MTEKEAIKVLQSTLHLDCKIADALGELEARKVAVKALETIAELKKRNLTLEHLENYMWFEDECIKKHFTFNSLLDAREKRTPKKPVQQSTDEKTHYKCCVCGSIKKTVYKKGRVLGNTFEYCDRCGQRQDWSEEV